MINELLVRYKQTSEKLHNELLAVREQLAQADQFNAYLLDRLDQKDALIEDLEEEIEDLEAECDALVLERAKNYEVERKVWDHWQKLKNEGKF